MISYSFKPNFPPHGLKRPRLLDAASANGAMGVARSGGSVASPREAPPDPARRRVFILRALLRRRRAQALEPEASPANDLRAKLDETRTDVEEQASEAKDSASEADRGRGRHG